MPFFLLFCLITIISNALVLKRSDGKLITGNDLGPFRHQHHINKYFSDTLYSSMRQTQNTNVYILPNAAISTDPLINPVDYGADPTGLQDSTAAFKMAIKEALSRGAPNVNLSNGIHDCGGATIFLGGGDYLISETLVIPQYYGNIRITDGTIRANKNFSKSSYMILVGSEIEECPTGQGSCNQYINIDHFFCDCKQICYGCLHIVAGMASNVGPQVFFLGYNYAGVTTTDGHSLFLLNAWFGEFLYSDPRKSKYNDSTATSININNYDNIITDVIIFSSRIGLNISKGASILTGVHTWNLNTKAGGLGIVVTSHNIRLFSSYLDHNDLVLYTPIGQVSIDNTYFLSGTLRLVTTKGNGDINSLSIFDSQYNGGNGTINTIELDESNGKFTKINNVFIKDTVIVPYSAYIQKSTRVSKKLKQTMSTQWIFDFSKELLFENIDIVWIEYTFQFNGDSTVNKESIIHYIDEPNGLSVSVKTNQKANATVYITVDQSNNFQY